MAAISAAYFYASSTDILCCFLSQCTTMTIYYDSKERNRKALKHKLPLLHNIKLHYHREQVTTTIHHKTTEKQMHLPDFSQSLLSPRQMDKCFSFLNTHFAGSASKGFRVFYRFAVFDLAHFQYFTCFPKTQHPTK